jgi:hypothetical protein
VTLVQTQDSPQQVGRRAVARGAAWTVPIVTATAAAPAYAASPCARGASAARSVTWQSNATNDNAYTTQAGTLTGNSITVTSSFNSAVGDVRAQRNMASYSSQAAFELSNNIPPAGTTNIQNYWQEVLFTFTNKVSSLTFEIQDIDRLTTGQSNFWDQVALIPEAGASVSADLGVDLAGTGTLLDPWRSKNGALSGAESGNYEARQTADVTVTGGFTTFRMRYWTTVGRQNTSQMWIRISGMEVRNCL